MATSESTPSLGPWPEQVPQSSPQHEEQFAMDVEFWQIIDDPNPDIGLGESAGKTYRKQLLLHRLRKIGGFAFDCLRNAGGAYGSVTPFS